MKKKVIVIGGGVSGITSGIYLLSNNYDVEIIELNRVLGGACIGWDRKGNHIDGCIHWLTGTNSNSSYYELWTDTHAILPNTDIFRQESFGCFDFGDGKKLEIWADVDKLENELISFAPEDAAQIREFCFLIRRFQRIEGPVHKPVDMMNIFELIKIGFTMVDDFYWATAMSKIDCKEYGNKFKNRYVRRLFDGFMAPGYNLMSFLYMLGHVSSGNGGIPAGGSKAMVDRMLDYYTRLGGTVRAGEEVSEVIIEKNTAVGVRLKSGEEIMGDWVVSTVPVETCLKNLLKGRYKVPAIEKRLADEKTYPIYTYSTVVFKCRKDISDEPLGRQIYFDPIMLDKEYDQLSVRNYSYDESLRGSDGSVVVQANMLGDDGMYYYWKDLKNSGKYYEAKKEFAARVQAIVEEKVPSLKGCLEIIDIVTPCTYERYLHSRHGSFQGFVHTYKGKQLMQKGIVPGLKNFILSGQWIFYSGGLPPAAITGRFAAQRICKADGIKFAAPSTSSVKVPDAFRRKVKN